MNIKCIATIKHNKSTSNANNKKMNSVKRRALDFFSAYSFIHRGRKRKGRNTRAGSYVVKK